MGQSSTRLRSRSLATVATTWNDFGEENISGLRLICARVPTLHTTAVYSIILASLASLREIVAAPVQIDSRKGAKLAKKHNYTWVRSI